MRLVWVLAVVALAALVAWAIAPDVWLLTAGLLSGGGAAVRAVSLSPVPRWWRYVVGLPPVVLVLMVWTAQGRGLVLLLWILALLLMRLALRGLLQRGR